MLEEPKQHDFDQRHDGPNEVPNLVHDSTHDKPRHASAPHATKETKSKSVQHNGGVKSPPPVHIPRRNSTTEVTAFGKVDRDASPTGVGVTRKSMQISRAPRPSEDFDRRYDGPYGRPSITMIRRKSSQAFSPTGRQSEPELPIPEDDATNRPSFEKMQSDPAFEPEPPALGYDLRTKKRKLALFWTFVIIDSVLMPIGLYFGLWYTVYKDGTMSANTVYSIVTAAIGGIAIFEYFIRSWALWKKSSNCRPSGAGRWYFDWFQWNYTIGWVIIMLELIV